MGVKVAKQGSSSGKNLILVVIGVLLVIALLAGAAFAVKRYYDSRYDGSLYYTQVPVGEDVAVGDLLDASGKVADQGYSYSLIGYNETGEERVLEFDVRTSDANQLYQPGTYLEVKASPTLVLSEQPIAEADVPAAALELIKGN